MVLLQQFNCGANWTRSRIRDCNFLMASLSRMMERCYVMSTKRTKSRVHFIPSQNIAWNAGQEKAFERTNKALDNVTSMEYRICSKIICYLSDSSEHRWTSRLATQRKYSLGNWIFQSLIYQTNHCKSCLEPSQALQQNGSPMRRKLLQLCSPFQNHTIFQCISKGSIFLLITRTLFLFSILIKEVLNAQNGIQQGSGISAWVCSWSVSYVRLHISAEKWMYVETYFQDGEHSYKITYWNFDK